MGRFLEWVIEQVIKEMKSHPITLVALFCSWVVIGLLWYEKAEAEDVTRLERGVQTTAEETVLLKGSVEKGRFDSRIDAYKREIRELELRKAERELDGKPPSPMYDDKIRMLRDQIAEAERDKAEAEAEENRRLNTLRKNFQESGEISIEPLTGVGH